MKYIIGSVLFASLLQIFLWLNNSDKFISPPDADNIIKSLSYAPYKGTKKELLSDDEILHDLTLIKRFTKRIRLYSASDAQKVLPFVKQLGMHIHFGIWISSDEESNKEEIALAKTLIPLYYTSISSVIVGNEVLLRKDLKAEELVPIIRDIKEFTHDIYIKSHIKVHEPLVSTAEVWNIWLENPSLGKEVDFIDMHILPYWEKIQAEDFVPFFKEVYNNANGLDIRTHARSAGTSIAPIPSAFLPRMRRGSIPSGPADASSEPRQSSFPMFHHERYPQLSPCGSVCPCPVGKPCRLFRWHG